jgi:hypothetical protein
MIQSPMISVCIKLSIPVIRKSSHARRSYGIDKFGLKHAHKYTDVPILQLYHAQRKRAEQKSSDH